jgi:hypothetical protein
MLWEHVAGGSNPSVPTIDKIGGGGMKKILRCPQSNKISLAEDCLKCNCLFQHRSTYIECYFNGEVYITQIYDAEKLSATDI